MSVCAVSGFFYYKIFPDFSQLDFQLSFQVKTSELTPDQIKIAMVVNSTNPEVIGKEAEDEAGPIGEGSNMDNNNATQIIHFKTVSNLKIRG